MLRSTLCLASAFLALAAHAAASSPPRLFERWWEQADVGAAAVAACEERVQPGGALYQICEATPLPWNGELVVYAHGYVAPGAPLALPEEAALLQPTLTLLGYAWATTSYRSNGLAVLDAIADLEELLAIFTERKGAPSRVWLVGASQGGLIATLALERRPDLYGGALAMCGPYGGFGAQVDYFGDFRVVFDVLFPGSMPPSAVAIPEDLIAGWETHYETVVRPAIEDPANTAVVNDLLGVTGAAVDPADPPTRENTTSGLLWYNVFATNEAAGRLGGQPYDNHDRVYTGSSRDAEINATAARFVADPLARVAIEGNLDTSGRLERPLVTLHTTGDEIVPYWHTTRYLERVVSQGTGALYEHVAVERYGHCNVDALEVLDAFRRLVSRGR